MHKIYLLLMWNLEILLLKFTVVCYKKDSLIKKLLIILLKIAYDIITKIEQGNLLNM